MTTVYDFTAQALDGAVRPLSDYQGEVLLIVNVASKCGLTPQYAGLETLQRRYARRGFDVLGFPCNQFGEQEPGTAADIAQFCSLTYDVTFPMFAKVEVNGEGAHPLYAFLKREQRGMFGSDIKWNFTKFLIDREGRVIGRFAPNIAPESLERFIEHALDPASAPKPRGLLGPLGMPKPPTSARAPKAQKPPKPPKPVKPAKAAKEKPQKSKAKAGS